MSLSRFLANFFILTLFIQLTLADSTVDACKVCSFVLGGAIDHYQGNFMDEDDMRQQLSDLCTRLGNIDGAEVHQACDSLVQANIDQIYADLTKGMSAIDTCINIQLCKSPQPRVRSVNNRLIETAKTQ
ncbi:unnamed protein product, partial [Mesorhabditis belari]|uniref:Saposin B-type domain-containing protein n=1 Tax=Mesorhabditis belari TaxID=2138241 RepID=A0AAF3J4F1_9BILA